MGRAFVRRERPRQSFTEANIQIAFDVLVLKQAFYSGLVLTAVDLVLIAILCFPKIPNRLPRTIWSGVKHFGSAVLGLYVAHILSLHNASLVLDIRVWLFFVAQALLAVLIFIMSTRRSGQIASAASSTIQLQKDVST
jgi:hypothetical protein